MVLHYKSQLCDITEYVPIAKAMSTLIVDSTLTLTCKVHFTHLHVCMLWLEMFGTSTCINQGRVFTAKPDTSGISYLCGELLHTQNCGFELHIHVYPCWMSGRSKCENVRSNMMIIWHSVRLNSTSYHQHCNATTHWQISILFWDTEPSSRLDWSKGCP